MSRNRRRSSNGRGPTSPAPEPAQDDTEPMASTDPDPTPPETAAVAEEAQEPSPNGNGNGDGSAREAVAEPPAPTAAEPDPESPASEPEPVASAAEPSGTVTEPEPESPASEPAAIVAAEPESEASAAELNGTVTEPGSPASEPAATVVAEPEPAPEASAAELSGTVTEPDPEPRSPASEPAAIVAAEPEPEATSPGSEPAGSEVGPREIGAEAEATTESADDADAKDDEDDSEPEPSADESLSVEMAAGRVQQPPQQRRSRQRGVRAALSTLPVPEPGPSFWADLEGALADQQPLAIAARPAIRPITEPPPLSQPKLSDYLESTNVSVDRVRGTYDGGGGGGGSGRGSGSDPALPPGKAPDFGLGGNSGRGRKLLAVVVLVVLGLLIAGTIMGDGSDEPPTSTGAGAADEDQATTTAPPADVATTVPVVPGLEPEARLTPMGIGPLQMGLTLGEINGAGVTTNVDQPTFDASDGACFDARPAGAADLTLRFHGAEPGVGVADPTEGILGAVTIRDVDGSLRVTETEVGLGATEELVRDAHAGALEVSDNPSRPGGHVYLARSAEDPDYGIAYATDGRQVTEISVGEVALIGLNQACA